MHPVFKYHHLLHLPRACRIFSLPRTTRRNKKQPETFRIARRCWEDRSVFVFGMISRKNRRSKPLHLTVKSSRCELIDESFLRCYVSDKLMHGLILYLNNPKHGNTELHGDPIQKKASEIRDSRVQLLFGKTHCLCIYIYIYIIYI